MYEFYFIRNLEAALREFHPDILVYNAGTDVLEGDSLGLLAISAQVMKQHEILLNAINILLGEVCYSQQSILDVMDLD
jgi:acetoin utilization deacetylase AcuC-like enzyme